MCLLQGGKPLEKGVPETQKGKYTWKTLLRNAEKVRESDNKWGGPGALLDISQPTTISPYKSQVQLIVGNKPIDFLVEMGAIYLVLNMKLTKKSLDAVMVTGVTGQLQKQVFLQTLECQWVAEDYT